MKLRTFLATVVFACASLMAHAGEVTRPAAPTAFGEGEYRMGPEDLIEVFVWKEPDLTTTVTVRPDGKISLPLLNEVDASGKTAVELQAEVAGKLRKFVSNPVVSVIVKEVNSPKFSVLGQVRKPDRYRIKQSTTVLDAVALAGGFTDFAKRDKVTVIRRHGPRDTERIHVDLKRMVKDDGTSGFYVQPGDAIYVD